MLRGGKESAGFTIVETLIVLAVSAILAVSAMLLVAGRQAKTQFAVGANDLKQQLEQIINETRSGYYPGNGDFTCTPHTGAGGTPLITGGAAAQGTNAGCIFLGKAVEFGVPDFQSFATYPLVGNRQDMSNQEVSSYSAAKAVALTSHVDSSKTEGGLQFSKVTYYLSDGSSPSSTTQAVFALADSLGDYAPNATTGDLNSATEKLNLYYFSFPPNWSGPIVNGIDTGGVHDGSPTLNSLDLCFDGGAGKFAVITITGLGQLSVKLKIKTAC
ncbi:MAG TPA: type II secretion system protein [Candidatus Microsaccharimonas sp.]|nr:type II secretion system protein [Candidatus Microsaccharimonas sp.]